MKILLVDSDNAIDVLDIAHDVTQCVEHTDITWAIEAVVDKLREGMNDEWEDQGSDTPTECRKMLGWLKDAGAICEIGRIYVNTYLQDRVYGGPEEGGWWFDTKKPVQSVRCASEEEAENLEVERSEWCYRENKERNSDINSVASEGKYVVFVEDHPARLYPDGKPEYS